MVDKCRNVPKRGSMALCCAQLHKMSLNQGCYTGGHNNVLHYISAKCGLQARHTHTYICNTDMPSVHHTNYTAIPVEFSPTSLIPDMCIVFKDTQRLIIFELLVPLKQTLAKFTHIRKTNASHCAVILAQIHLMLN